MVYGCGNQCVKLIVFFKNLLLFALGGLVCGFSLWANLDKNFASHLTEFAHQVKIDDEFVDDLVKYQASLWVLVVIGAFLFVVGFLGCCGALCESMICLALQFILILVLIVAQIVALGYFLTNRSELMSSLKHFMDESSTTVDRRMNLLPIQKLLHCCGATPETVQLYINEGRCEGFLRHAPDCYSVITEKLENAGEIVVAIGVLCIVVEFFSTIFTCVLFRALRDRENPYIPAY